MSSQGITGFGPLNSDPGTDPLCWGNLIANLQAYVAGLPSSSANGNHTPYNVMYVEGMMMMLRSFYGSNSPAFNAASNAWNAYYNHQGSAADVQNAFSALANSPAPTSFSDPATQKQDMLQALTEYNMLLGSFASNNEVGPMGCMDGMSAALAFIVNESPYYSSDIANINKVVTTDAAEFRAYSGTGAGGAALLDQIREDIFNAEAGLNGTSGSNEVLPTSNPNATTVPWTDILNNLLTNLKIYQSSSDPVYLHYIQGMLAAMGPFWSNVSGGPFASDFQKLSADFNAGNLTAAIADAGQLLSDGTPPAGSLQNPQQAMANVMQQIQTLIDNQDLSKVMTDPGMLQGLSQVAALFANGLGCFSNQTVNDINTELFTYMPSFLDWCGDSNFAGTAKGFNDQELQQILQDLQA